MNIDKVYEELLEELPQTTIYKNEPMSKHTSFKIGGNADIYIKVKSVEEIVKIKEYAKKNGIPVTVIGNGSNILVRDNGIRGITIQVDIQDIKIEEIENDVFVYAASGVKLAALAINMQKEGITGFEFAGGIPGTIGGAVRMNAGAYGGEFSNVVEEVTYLDEENNIVTVPKEKVEFSYRHSIFVNSKKIVLGARLKLKKGNVEEIKQYMNELAQKRKEKQPLDMPSAGSTFKRGADFFTAALIDEAGLKGYTVGGAQVSTKHAGFVVNTGNATANDVLELVKNVKKQIYDKFGKKIELEIEVIGE